MILSMLLFSIRILFEQRILVSRKIKKGSYCRQNERTIDSSRILIFLISVSLFFLFFIEWPKVNYRIWLRAHLPPYLRLYISVAFAKLLPRRKLKCYTTINIKVQTFTLCTLKKRVYSIQIIQCLKIFKMLM